MNIMKWQIDTLIETVHNLAGRVGKRLTEEDAQLVAKCDEIYDKCIEDYNKNKEYKNRYRKEKLKEDPMYSRSKAEREKHAMAMAKKESTS